MKILFIYPDICTYSGGFQYGIGTISSVLKANGHVTFLFHVTDIITKDQLIEAINKITPDLIAFSSVTNQYQYVELYSDWIKQEFKIPILCGGIHATLCPEEVLSHASIDMICIGEGEYALLELADRMDEGGDIGNIMNLWVKKNEIIKNKLRPLVEDLDALPYPDRELFDSHNMLKKNGGIADIMAGRGCPYNCTYCCNHTLKKLYHGNGKYVRMRSVSNVLEEIGELVGNYDVKILNFNDDTFTLFPKWIKSFCDAYSREFDVPFLCNARADTVNRKMLLDLKNAGCEQIRIGIESGNELLRERVLNRKIKNEQIVDVFKLVHEIGIKTYAFNMVGLPFETPEMAEETIQLNEYISPDYTQVSIFYPYPGTELYDICKKNNLLLNEHKDSYFDDGAMINSPMFPAQLINDYYCRFKHLSFETFVRTYHPCVYPFYNISRKLIGDDLTEAILTFSKSKIGK